MKSIFSLILTMFIAISCSNTKPIRTVQGGTFASNLSMKEIASSIKTGGTQRGWVVKEGDKKNQFVANIQVRSHSLEVYVNYTKDGYTIDYKESANMKYDESSKSIHRNYYRWVQNLQRSIDREMQITSNNKA